MYKERLQKKLKAYCQIDSNNKNQCWEWHGQISNSGHGRIMIRDQITNQNITLSAESASYIAFIGEIPDGKVVCQKCTNRLCINPQHIELIDQPY